MRNRTIVAAAVLILSLLAFSAQAGDNDAPTAILLSCSGEVIVERNSGEKVPGSFGLALYAGDEVKTSADSGAEIHFENGMWLQVGSSSNMVIKSASTKTQPSGVKVGDGSFKVVRNMMRLKDPKGTSSLAALRSSPDKSEIALVSPCQTRVLTARPTFEWESDGLDEEMLLTVYDEKGICFEKKIPGGTNFEYPEEAPVLTAGISYSWTIETTDPLRVPPLRSAASFFEIITDEDAQELESTIAIIDCDSIPNTSTYHFLRASVYFDHGLLENAIGEMEMAMEGGSPTKEMHSILARLYAEAGRTGDAMSEYDRIFEE
jgi:hypothetical protein